MFPHLIFISMLSALHQLHMPKEQYVEALEGIARGIELHLKDVTGLQGRQFRAPLWNRGV